MTCELAVLHTPAPAAYLAWHTWAEAMHVAGWRQVRCPGCRLYEVWLAGDGAGPALPVLGGGCISWKGRFP